MLMLNLIPGGLVVTYILDLEEMMILTYLDSDDLVSTSPTSPATRMLA